MTDKIWRGTQRVAYQAPTQALTGMYLTIHGLDELRTLFRCPILKCPISDSVRRGGMAMNHEWTRLFFAFFIGVVVGLSSCSRHEATQEDVRAFFEGHKVGRSPDYAVVKNGTDYLAVIYGMTDDERTCMDLIKPYNEDQTLSTLPGAYSCVPLNR